MLFGWLVTGLGLKMNGGAVSDGIDFLAAEPVKTTCPDWKMMPWIYWHMVWLRKSASNSLIPLRMACKQPPHSSS